jgi:2-methylisocitrate lyase-like PEP mutase family enzyme
VVKAVAPKPVNFLHSGATDFSVSDVAAMGVRRISTGGALARTAWTGFIRAAREIAEQGGFGGLNAGTVPNAELNAFFRDDLKRRGS